ncbi:MAG: serine hydrolase domain-containing protein [Bacteroidota bacterium]
MKPITCILFFLGSLCVQAQEINYNLIEQKIDSAFKSQNAKGMQFIIVNSDSILLNKNYGIHPKSENSVNDQTLYLLNAVTEPFTALGLLHLLKSKGISVDAELKEIAPEVSFENKWEQEYPLTLRHLIAHTSGWQKGYFYHFLLDRSRLSLEEIVLNYPQSRVSQYPPGQFYSHTNDGYATAGYLIEKISGVSYEEYIAQTVLEPLGMRSSSFDLESVHLAVQKNSPAPYPRMTELPSDGLVTNATDMSLFLQFLLNEGKKDSVQVIEPSIIQQVKATPNTLFDTELNTIAQGYGLYKIIFRGTEIILVKGSDPQFSAQLILIPEQGIGVFFALSGDETTRITLLNSLLSDLIPSKYPVEYTPAEQEAEWLGYYQSIGYSFKIERFINNLISVVRIDYVEGKLYYGSLFERPQPMYRDKEGNLLINDRNFNVKWALVEDFEKDIVLTNANGEKFRKTSGFVVWTKLLLAITFLVSIISLSIVGLSRLIARYLAKKSLGINKSLRLFQLSLVPLFLIILVIISLVPGDPLQSYQSMQQFASISFHSVALFVLSLSFGVIGLLAIISTVRNLKSTTNKVMKAYMFLLATTFSITLSYLTAYGIVGIRGWTM